MPSLLSNVRRATVAASFAVKAAAGAFKMRWSGYGGSDYGTSFAGTFGAALRRLLPGATRDFEAQAAPLWKNSAVAIGLAWVRKNFPEARLTVQQRTGAEWQELPEHPLLEWLDEPNEDYDADALYAATALSLLIDGNAYWVMGRAPNGRLGFWYVPHWQMLPCWPTDGSEFISHYVQIVDGKRVIVPKNCVIHFRMGLDPENERLGLSDLKTACREVVADNAANSYTAHILENMGIVGLLISPESPDDEIGDPKGLKKDVETNYTAEGRGGVMVVSTSLKLTEMGMTPEKLALDKIRRVPQQRIVAALGLSELVLAIGGNDGNSLGKAGELAQANRHAYENCLIPLQKTIAKQLQRQLPPNVIGPPHKERLRWDYSDVQAMREDQAELSNRVVMEWLSGLRTKDEGRGAIGLPPAKDGKGDTYFTGQPLKGAIPTIGDDQVKGDAA